MFALSTERWLNFKEMKFLFFWNELRASALRVFARTALSRFFTFDFGRVRAFTHEGFLAWLTPTARVYETTWYATDGVFVAHRAKVYEGIALIERVKSVKHSLNYCHGPQTLVTLTLYQGQCPLYTGLLLYHYSKFVGYIYHVISLSLFSQSQIHSRSSTASLRSHCERSYEDQNISFKPFFTFSSHTEYKKRKYCKRMIEKKILSFWWICFVYLRSQKKEKKSVRLSVCLYVRGILAVDTITLEGVISGSKQNLLGVFDVLNVGLVLKSKGKSLSWFWSWSWTGFWFWQKLCGTTPNLVGIFNI